MGFLAIAIWPRGDATRRLYRRRAAAPMAV